MQHMVKTVSNIKQIIGNLKKIEDYLPEEHVITIQSPQRKIKQRKLFTFLDEEEEHGE